jgi:acyl-CoA thioester hydrolase
MYEISVPVEVSPGYIDEYGHVNNAYYPLLFELGRRRLQEKLGLSDQSLKERGLALVVVKLDCEYIRQLRLGEQVYVKSRLFYNGGARLTMEHRLEGNDKLYATERTEHVFIKLDNGKPIKPRKELLGDLV